MSAKARAGLFLGMGLLAMAMLVGVYQYGVMSGHQQFDSDQETIASLNKNINDLRQQLATSEENLIIAQRHRQIQDEAYKQISSAYASSEQKNRYLGSRLDFYRSIISPEDGKAGPAIQGVEAQRKNNNLTFDVTLVQAIRHKHQVMGKLKAELYSDDEVVAKWPENSPRSVSFQYFQQVSGVFENVNVGKAYQIRVVFEIKDGATIERFFDISTESVSAAE